MVRGTTDAVELGGGGGGFGFEGDGFRAHGDVEAVEVIQLEGFGIAENGAGGADVQDAELAAGEEEIGAGLALVFERDGCGGGDSGDGETIEVGEGPVDRRMREKLIDEEDGA